MTAATSLQEQIGSLRLPVQSSQSLETLTSLDPARRVLADLFKAAIEAELTEAWQVVAARLQPENGISNDTPVADVLELEPTGAVMTSRQAKFPLLAVYRSGKGEYQPHTLYDERLIQPWTVDWVLGAVDVATNFQLGDVPIAVSKIISRCLARGGHPAYEDGAPQFGAERGDIGAIRVVSHEGPGQARFVSQENGPTYYAITIHLESIEYVHEREGGAADGLFEGVDSAYGIGGEPAGVIQGLLYTDTDTPVG